MPAEFAIRPNDAVKLHDDVTINANATSTKSARFIVAPRAATIYWKKTSGTGTLRLRFYAVTAAGDFQIGADQTATSGSLDLPAAQAAYEVKVEVTETTGLATVVMTTELHAR